MDSNRGPLALKATTLPTAPQPLPYCHKIFLNIWSQMAIIRELIQFMWKFTAKNWP